jgi:hypothetical protein
VAVQAGAGHHEVREAALAERRLAYGWARIPACPRSSSSCCCSCSRACSGCRSRHGFPGAARRGRRTSARAAAATPPGLRPRRCLSPQQLTRKAIAAPPRAIRLDTVVWGCAGLSRRLRLRLAPAAYRLQPRPGLPRPSAGGLPSQHCLAFDASQDRTASTTNSKLSAVATASPAWLVSSAPTAGTNPWPRHSGRVFTGGADGAYRRDCSRPVAAARAFACYRRSRGAGGGLLRRAGTCAGEGRVTRVQDARGSAGW